MAFWSAGPKCGNYFHAAESGRRCDQMTLSIPDLCPCAIQSRPFGLPYGYFFTTQGHESRSWGVNDSEIFLWIILTVDAIFWMSAHTETEDHSKQIQTNISRSLTPPTSFSKMSKDVKRCPKGLRHFVILYGAQPRFFFSASKVRPTVGRRLGSLCPKPVSMFETTQW